MPRNPMDGQATAGQMERQRLAVPDAPAGALTEPLAERLLLSARQVATESEALADSVANQLDILIGPIPREPSARPERSAVQESGILPAIGAELDAAFEAVREIGRQLERLNV